MTEKSINPKAQSLKKKKKTPTKPKEFTSNKAKLKKIKDCKKQKKTTENPCNFN